MNFVLLRFLLQLLVNFPVRLRVLSRTPSEFQLYIKHHLFPFDRLAQSLLDTSLQIVTVASNSRLTADKQSLCRSRLKACRRILLGTTPNLSTNPRNTLLLSPAATLLPSQTTTSPTFLPTLPMAMDQIAPGPLLMLLLLSRGVSRRAHQPLLPRPWHTPGPPTTRMAHQQISLT
jgi:hypothetical protein